MQEQSSTPSRVPEIVSYPGDVPRKLSKPRPRQGARLAALRRAAGLTQAELADLIGDVQPNIAYWEASEMPPLRRPPQASQSPRRLRRNLLSADLRPQSPSAGPSAACRRSSPTSPSYRVVSRPRSSSSSRPSSISIGGRRARDVLRLVRSGAAGDHLVIHEQFLVEVMLKRDHVPTFDEYPFALPAVRKLDVLTLHPSVTFFAGENRDRESTLLEAIAVACGFNAEGGSKNFGFATHPSHSSLHGFLRISQGIRKPKTGWFLRAESFYNVASEMDCRDEGISFDPPIRTYYGGTSLHRQSHGESFMALLTHRFTASGLYLLDEPEAALSPHHQLAALARVHELAQNGAQFIIATHSPILMAYPNAKILAFGDDGIRATEYTHTEHFRIAREFFSDHVSALRKVMHDEKA